jgi:hypothetical protein
MLTEDFWRENDRLIFEAAKDPVIRETAEISQSRCYAAMVDYFEKHGVNVNVKQIRSRMDKYRNHLKNYRTRNKVSAPLSLSRLFSLFPSVLCSVCKF